MTIRLLQDGLTFEPKDHVYTHGDRVLLSITQVLRDAGLVDVRWYTPEAAERGKAVHAACHYFDEGALDDACLHDVVRPYFEGWRKFRAQMPGFRWLFIEEPGFSPMYNFAGTPDRVGEFDGGPCVVEIKTGSSLPWWAALQTAAQAILIPAAQHIRRFAVHLPGDGTYRLTEYEDWMDRDRFVAAVTVAQMRREHGGATDGDYRAGAA